MNPLEEFARAVSDARDEMYVAVNAAQRNDFVGTAEALERAVLILDQAHDALAEKAVA